MSKPRCFGTPYMNHTTRDCGYNINEDVMKELQLQPIVNYKEHYQINWVNCVAWIQKEPQKPCFAIIHKGNDLSARPMKSGLKTQQYILTCYKALYVYGRRLLIYFQIKSLMDLS